MGCSVEIHFLRQSVGEGAEGGFGRGIGGVAGYGEEGEKRGGEDKVAGLLRAWVRGIGLGGRFEPGVQDGVRHVGGGKVVGVHLVLEFRCGGVDEEGWVGATGAAPDDVGRRAIVEGCGLGNDGGGLGRVDEVGGDRMEALSLGVGGTLLEWRFSHILRT